MLHPGVTRALAGAAMAATLLALATPAASADESEYVAQAVRVRLAGIDTDTKEGAARAYRLIRNAASRACDVGDGTDPECVQRAVSGAVLRLDAPAVNALLARGARSPGA